MVAFNSDVLSIDDQYVLNRVYHTKTFEDGNHFHRRIMYVWDIRGDTENNVDLVQYCLEEEERDFGLKPNGNSCKDGAQGFTRTQFSNLATLKEKCATLGPRKAVKQLVVGLPRLSLLPKCHEDLGKPSLSEKQ